MEEQCRCTGESTILPLSNKVQCYPFHYISNKPYLISCQHSRSTPSLPHLRLLDSRRHPPAEHHPPVSCRADHHHRVVVSDVWTQK
ncbi:hypothetical protein HanRHA438_Chr11g0485511 [Helianthus annuus]|uniref:Uncharacterized protein n=1 Tax=Helianthus annuus TaxID=4232 RepID=A0A251T848_HELAN|nr:hypothetical protein HanXRQr2_Chr11g0471911 [Helianthus annuus]KAJ0500258.1 hypothetical protein HanHA300_Chr11g0387631 [Helianthus annuus]KAJ0516090.1 hypothetical protein HanHA89_Chr11g0410001 [Helianthus annuus]KAJ0688066.1 hypothetical protein HanOQP8_Chr11g0390281 [Helianthus annuus]KAJ0798581.1 hypothetical protein HanLR1_Chr00c2892g0860591 [Helianthus annuus]